MPYWNLFYHLVWATKERLALITPEIEPRLYSVLTAKSIELGATVYAVGGIENHVHIAVAIPPTVTISDFVKHLKGSSSHFVNNELGVEFKWQSEYGVLSFGQRQLDTVVNYVKTQHQHHSDNTIMVYLERMG